MSGDMLEGILRVLATLSPEVPKLTFGKWEVSPTARACVELELYGDTRPTQRNNWVEPFVEEPPEDLHQWPSSYFTDSGDDPELQMPMLTVSSWDASKRGRQSWQS